MRSDSRATFAFAGTIAIHVVLAFIGDALIEAIPPKKYERPPTLELVDIEPEPPPAPPPPAPEPEPRPRVARTTQAPPPEAPPPPADTPPSPDSGGAPVTTMENIAPAATGVAVAKGPRSTGRIGRGGTGGGTGSGAGAGSSDAPPAPMSVATIKKRAMPKGDFSYFDASKDYPAEAKQLGIEGVIRVRLIVDASGSVKSAVLLTKLGHGLDDLALERAKKIQFDPATDTDDKPVTSVVVWTFNMTLPK